MAIKGRSSGLIGKQPIAPSSSLPNGTASGLWTLEEALYWKKQDLWPTQEPAFGQAYAGGYYAGKIVQGGVKYDVIVAPKASGEIADKWWQTSEVAGPTATKTLNNGPAASAAMNSASYPAAQFCEGLSIGGYTDWYLPSRDELELCYRNLKPYTTDNWIGTRNKSAYTYPEGNDVSGDNFGVNRNSSPAGTAYTSSNPAMTSATAFQSGGTESFISFWYWCSSEYASDQAWACALNFGGAFTFQYKTYGLYVRAVRRVVSKVQ